MRATELSPEPIARIAPPRPLDLPELDREFAAVVFVWAASGVHDDRPSALALRRRVEALCASSVHVAVVSDVECQVVDDRLRARPNGPGRFLVATSSAGSLHEVNRAGPSPLRRFQPTSGGALTAIFDELAGMGIGPGLVLVVGDELGSGEQLLVPAGDRAVVLFVGAGPAGASAAARALGGGPLMLRALLDAVLARRAQGRVPSIDEDPEWVLREVSADPHRRRVAESLFTLVSGGFGTRGSIEEPARGSMPLTVAAGGYTGTGTDQQLLPGPGWTTVQFAPLPGRDVRQLDLRTGVLLRAEQGDDEVPLRTARLVSHATPGLMLMRAECAPKRMTPGPALVARDAMAELRGHRHQWRSTAHGVAGTHIHAVATQHERRGRTVHVLDRLVVYTANGQDEPGRLPERLLDAADRVGFDQLLAEHRAAWARRWEAVNIRIPADPAAQLAARFAIFHLWSHAGRHDELAVGARGLTGPGHGGRVRWDADVFVLPAMASIDPAAADAMVRYRYARLAAAREHATAAGLAGARFPWESAAQGYELAPASGRVDAPARAEHTGELAEHVTADVAWSAAFCAEWQGREPQPGAPEVELLAETARYWARRCRRDGDGSAHIDQVTGPDRFHEDVDDNAFTNVMARWNLRAAARFCGGPEASGWRDLADALVDGYDTATGRYEQFRGYFGIEAQVIEQPDVLLLHHLVPDETARGSLRANLDHYGPRTAHGSSPSPAITAALLARAGRPDEALDLLRLAMAVDLEDRTGSTAAGLHLAALGGVWQALLFGFVGARVRGTTLHIDPRLPAAWPQLEIRFLALGRHVRLHIEGEDARIWADGSLRVRAGDRDVDVPGETEVRMRFATRNDE